jgi:hypothetical protein
MIRSFTTASQIPLVLSSIVSLTACVAELSEAGEDDEVSSVTQELQGCTTKSGDGSFVCLTDDRQWIQVCDQQADGNYAYARTYRYGAVQEPLYDQNGSSAGCSFYAANLWSLDSYNICVQNEGCGAPVYRYW